MTIHAEPHWDHATTVCYHDDMKAIVSSLPVTGGHARLNLATRFPAELMRDTCGDYTLNVGRYGVDRPAGGWSVETGYSPLGKDLAYWQRVCDNAPAIDAWLAAHRPVQGLRLAVTFEDDTMHIRNYDWPDRAPLVVLRVTAEGQQS